ncbi:Phosphatidylinositol 4-kinase beta [Glugoides intestinalis]
MFEYPSSQISKVTNLNFLTPIVLHKSNDKHFYISLLFRITNPGIHYILCVRLRSMNVLEEIPQLIEIMIKDVENEPISHPVYNLLRLNAKKDKKFRLGLFLRLKSVLAVVDEIKATYCYFLCCDILEIDSAESRRNMSFLFTRYSYLKSKNQQLIAESAAKNRLEVPNSTEKPKNHRKFRESWHTRTFYVRRRSKSPSLNGLMLYFVKSVISIFNTPLFNQLDDFCKAFNSKRNFIALQFKSGRTKFKKNVLFLENLVDISTKLKKIPVKVRQRTLRIYLEIINMELCGTVQHPFLNNQKIVRFSLDHAKVLDSAENCPFIVTCECAEFWVPQKNCQSAKLKKAKTLLKQLESLNDIGELGDVNEIKESLVTALEDVLFNKVRDIKELLPVTVKVEENIKEKEYSQVIKEEVMAESSFVEKATFNQIEEGMIDFYQSDYEGYRKEDVENGLLPLVRENPLNIEILSTSNNEFDELLLDSKALKVSDLEESEKYEAISVYSCDYPGTPLLMKPTENSFSAIREELEKSSAHSALPGWNISSFIVKSGNVLKHEYLAYQVLTQMKEIFLIENLPIYIRNYKIFLISDTAGIVETVKDAQSVHRLKSETKFRTLKSYFQSLFSDEKLEIAKKSFLYSLVGYSLASYILQLKDRHNGNILIDGFGHIIHVDLGFTFGMHPGIISVENAPFKFSSEYLELIDDQEFKDLFINGFKALRRHKEKLSRLVEIMQDSGYFEKPALEQFVDRLRLLDSDDEIDLFCLNLIEKSIRNMRTMFYDQFQYLSNGYL